MCLYGQKLSVSISSIQMWIVLSLLPLFFSKATSQLQSSCHLQVLHYLVNIWWLQLVFFKEIYRLIIHDIRKSNLADLMILFRRQIHKSATRIRNLRLREFSFLFDLHVSFKRKLINRSVSRWHSASNVTLALFQRKNISSCVDIQRL